MDNLFAVPNHSEPLTSEQRMHHAEAQRDVLLEVLEIFAHDLSNPLQSLIVLSELALDDCPEGTEEYDRVRQSLEAAERMRTLVQGLAGLTRSIDGPRSARTVVDRFISVFSRRWERNQVRISVDLEMIEQTPTPGVLQTILLNVGLAASEAVAGDRTHPRYELSVRGISRDNQTRRRYALEITLVGHNAGGSAEPVELDPEKMKRIDRLVGGNDAVQLTHEGSTIFLEFAAESRRG